MKFDVQIRWNIKQRIFEEEMPGGARSCKTIGKEEEWVLIAHKMG